MQNNQLIQFVVSPDGLRVINLSCVVHAYIANFESTYEEGFLNLDNNNKNKGYNYKIIVILNNNTSVEFFRGSQARCIQALKEFY